MKSGSCMIHTNELQAEHVRFPPIHSAFPCLRHATRIIFTAHAPCQELPPTTRALGSDCPSHQHTGPSAQGAMLSADRWICDSSSCSGMQHPRQTSNLKRPQTTTYNPTFLLLKAPVATGMIQSLQHVLLPEIVRIDPWRHTKGLVFQAAKHPQGKAECQAPYRRWAVHRMHSRPPRRRSLPTPPAHASPASAVKTSVQPN